MQDLNGYKDNESNKNMNTNMNEKNDKKKKKMDCSIEAAAIVDRIKIQFNFSNTIQAMDYVIKALPTDLRYLLHDFARKNITLLKETYSDLINSWELASDKEFNWVNDYCGSDTVPVDPSFDELLLTIMINFSDRYVLLENENTALKLELSKLEQLRSIDLKEWKIKEADLYDLLEGTWKDVLRWELLEECLVNTDRVGSPKLLQPESVDEGLTVIKHQPPYELALEAIEQLYKSSGLELPYSLRNYRAAFER